MSRSTAAMGAAGSPHDCSCCWCAVPLSPFNPNTESPPSHRASNATSWRRLYAPPFGQSQSLVFGVDCDKDDARWPCLCFFGETYGFNAHGIGGRSGNNVLFADYHVTTVKGFDPRYMTFDPHERGKSFDDVARRPDD